MSTSCLEGGKKMAVNYFRIGQRIKAIRKMKRISQAELAEATELSVNYISCIETGKRHSSLDVLIRIADELGVSVDHLLNGSQANDETACLTELAHLLKDCSRVERAIILDVASATKESIRANQRLTSERDV
jgi:transcriptional regulator with XRE-family HTH domain